tara:strand:- start:986 stop:1909 length:924 start_codon:yes stop_codon:yes gene_type:complete
MIIKYLIILVFIIFSSPASAEYKGLSKISKNNTFMDQKGKPYSIDDISDKANTLLIIWNHGSDQDAKVDPCELQPKSGYIWDGAVVPAFLKLHNKKVNNLNIKIYRLCSGVKGMTVADQKKIRKNIKKGENLNLFTEYKQIKRQNIILAKSNEFIESGFKNIVLAGWSAGGWASLNLQSRYPEKFNAAIALNPAFAGPKKEWKKKYPEWGAFRDHQINIINESNSLNALILAHKDDIFEDIETLSFFKSFTDLKFIDYSQLKPTSCTWADVDKKMQKNKGHNIPQSKCFTKYVEKNNLFLNYLESIF